jgi:hypothetical protein
MPNDLNDSILQASLEGLEWRREQLEEHIRSVRSMLAGTDPGRRGPGRPRKTESEPVTDQASAPRKRQGMSAAGRRKIAEAQRKRWAAKRGETAAPATKKAITKRGISAAGRKRLAEAMRQRWALKRTAAQAKAAKKTAGGRKNAAGAKKVTAKRADGKRAPRHGGPGAVDLAEVPL